MKSPNRKQKIIFISILIGVSFLTVVIAVVLYVNPFKPNLSFTSSLDEIRKSFKNDEKTDNVEIGKIKDLVDQSIRTSDDEKRDQYLTEAAQTLFKQPELIPPFIEFFVMKNGEEWYVDRGLEIMRTVGKKRLYDPKRFVELIKSDRFKSDLRWAAIKCITVMSDQIDERVLFDLLSDTKWSDVRGTVIDFTMSSLAEVTDRKKASRILRKCLEATAGVEPHQIHMTLVSFTLFTDKNEDVFAGMLSEPLQPHETVIVAASLLKEKWPDDHPQQKIAEDASKKSEVAKAFLQEYLDHRP